jgi:hypothetical protein
MKYVRKLKRYERLNVESGCEEKRRENEGGSVASTSILTIPDAFSHPIVKNRRGVVLSNNTSDSSTMIVSH